MPRRRRSSLYLFGLLWICCLNLVFILLRNIYVGLPGLWGTPCSVRTFCTSSSSPSGRAREPNWRAAELRRSALHGRAERRRPPRAKRGGRQKVQGPHLRWLPGGTTFPAMAAWSKPGRTLSTPLRADHAPSGQSVPAQSLNVRYRLGVIGYRVDSARPGCRRLWIAGKAARGWWPVGRVARLAWSV